MSQKKFLNLGCGNIIMPAAKPVHWGLIPDAVCNYALWHNVDRNAAPGVDEEVDLFRYPWPWDDNSFDGALAAHLVEHIPHEIHIVRNQPARVNTPGLSDAERLQMDRDNFREWDTRCRSLTDMQDGWYAFWSELYRVLTPGARVHVLSPYAWSQGGVTDPTHTRLITEHTFTHAMAPEPDAPFRYNNGGLHFKMVGYRFNITPMFQHLLPTEDDTPEEVERKDSELKFIFMTQINVAYELYVVTEVVK